jgi:subtilisin family serine protease
MPLRRIVFFLLAYCLCSSIAEAQTKYWVFFKDKHAGDFDPYAFFDVNAIGRRLKSGSSLFDYSDLPVSKEYIKQVAKFADSMGNATRWFNGVGAWINPQNLEAVRALPFVKQVVCMSVHLIPLQDDEDVPDDSELVKLQISSLQGEQFLDNYFKGKGIRIAVLDVGYKGAKTHRAFQHLFKNNQIIETFDFLRHDSDVYRFGSHGTMVLSCLAGMQGDTPMGLAQDAEFLLARTERNFTEWSDEEDSWLAAVEWADQKGAHIVSSSLGYTDRRYFETDMNGHTSLVSRAANLAARKGMLVVIAAGNEARGQWKYICTPGDADSALTVGGTNPKTNFHASFSSFGPSADGDLKPNVVASGYAWVADANSFSSAMGTSFATPFVAGFAACVWNMFPEWDNMKLYKQIEHSGQLYPYFDYAHGYGTPQAGYFVRRKFNEGSPVPQKPKEPTFHFDTTHYDFAISLHSMNPDDSTVIPDLDKKLVYYHVTDTTGKIIRYYVTKPKIDYDAKPENMYYPVTLNWDEIPEHGTIRVHFDGYTNEQEY